jgi:hypothetical protein
MTDQVKSAILVVSGILVGASATYLITKSHFEEKYKRFADEEIASVKEAFGVVQEAEKLVRENEEHMSQYITRDTEDEVEFVHIKRKTVGDLVAEDIAAAEAQDIQDHFEVTPKRDDAVVELDLTEEERSKDYPYVITAEEFFTEGETNEKICLAYYEGDETLADDAQDKIDDVEEKIGTANLLRFGHGSDDPNSVYIRNEKLECDFEVVREDGSYAKLVLGLDESDGYIPVDKAYALKHKNARNRE